MSELVKRDDNALTPAVQEAVLLGGDLERLRPEQRVEYMITTCKSLGLNPLTKPFEFIKLNGKLVMYARKDATEQLRKLNGVSIAIIARELTDDVYVVTARATDKQGRADESIGAVPLKGLTGEAKANALMKAETKAKRRVTLSISGLGMLDETEAEDLPGAQRVALPDYTPPPAKEAPRSEAPKGNAAQSAPPSPSTPSAAIALNVATAIPSPGVADPKGPAAPPAVSHESGASAPVATTSASEREPGSDDGDDIDAMDDPNDKVECFDKHGVQSWEPRRSEKQSREFFARVARLEIKEDDYADDHGVMKPGWRTRCSKRFGKQSTRELSVREMDEINDILKAHEKRWGTPADKRARQERRVETMAQDAEGSR